MHSDQITQTATEQAAEAERWIYRVTVNERILCGQMTRHRNVDQKFQIFENKELIEESEPEQVPSGDVRLFLPLRLALAQQAKRLIECVDDSRHRQVFELADKTRDFVLMDSIQVAAIPEYRKYAFWVEYRGDKMEAHKWRHLSLYADAARAARAAYKKWKGMVLKAVNHLLVETGVGGAGPTTPKLNVALVDRLIAASEAKKIREVQ